MLDIKAIRENPDKIELELQKKDPSLSLRSLLSLDQQKLKLQSEVEELKSVRKQNAKNVGEKKRKGEDVSSFLKEMEGVNKKLNALEKELALIAVSFKEELLTLPNLPEQEI